MHVLTILISHTSFTQYEAVHPMTGWVDLKRRLSPYDRRVYTFTHACLPGEPLVVLHTALAHAPATHLAQVLPQHTSTPGTAPTPGTSTPVAESTFGAFTPRTASKPETAETPVSAPTPGAPTLGASAPVPPSVAIFYSISSTQPGLSGVDLGHFLIKKAAELVQVIYVCGAQGSELLLTSAFLPLCQLCCYFYIFKFADPVLDLPKLTGARRREGRAQGTTPKTKFVLLLLCRRVPQLA